MFFARLLNHVFDIEFAAFAGIELLDADLDLRTQRVELIEVIDQFACNTILLGFRQCFDPGDGVSQNFCHGQF
jgi:hypothetical protein